MHLSLIFSTLVSFVVLAAAYPTNSLGKREELDSNLFGHLTDGRKLPDKRCEHLAKREELDSNLVGYAGYFDEPDKRSLTSPTSARNSIPTSSCTVAQLTLMSLISARNSSTLVRPRCMGS
ncbi:hypothetical protein DFH29DRAFT_952457, partial [Suillus ampliporus]